MIIDEVNEVSVLDIRNIINIIPFECQREGGYLDSISGSSIPNTALENLIDVPEDHPQN